METVVAEKTVVTHRWDDVGFFVQLEADPDPLYIEIRAYRLIGVPDDPLLFERNSDKDMDFTDDVVEAAVYLHGSIKWDGCANLAFDEQARVMLHFCDRESAGNIGRLLEKLYDAAAELMPRRDW